MRELRNLCVNPKPAKAGGSIWVATDCTVQVGADSILLSTPEDGGVNGYASFLLANLAAGDYVFAMLLNSYSGQTVPTLFNNRVLLATDASGVLGGAYFDGLGKLYECRFTVPSAENVRLRIQAPQPGKALRYRQTLVCTADDYDAMTKQGVAWFDGDTYPSVGGGYPLSVRFVYPHLGLGVCA